MAKICKKCGKKIGFSEYSYNGECEQCYKVVRNNEKSDINRENKNSNEDNNELLLVICFLIPIIGAIIYIANASTRRQYANLYGKTSLIGFIVGIIIGLFIMIVQ